MQPGATTVNTSEVRQTILKDHAYIRGLLDEIDELVDRYTREGGAANGEDFCTLSLGLYKALAEHLTREDEILVPILRVSGPDGLAHARQLGREHRVQRELLEFLTDRLSKNDIPTVIVVRQLQNFVEYLRFDMIHEEQVILAE